MIKLLSVVALFYINCQPLFAQVKIFVSPVGNDQNPGTIDRPLASLTGARDFIRKYKTDHVVTDTIIVTIADGFYCMEQPLLLNATDAGTVATPVIFRAATGSNPVFSGGKKVSGFTVEDGVWKLPIPESARYNWQFFQLYVNGNRATLARTPDKGFHYIKNVKETIWEQGEERIAARAQQKISLNEDYFKPLLKLKPGELNDVQFRTYHNWDFTLRHIDRLVSDSLQLVTSGKGMQPWNPIKPGERIVFENFEGALNAPGEWFLNNKGILHYIPLPGETPENSEVIIPVLEQLISIEGDAVSNNYVQHISFEGLTFSHSLYRVLPSGFEPYQASIYTDAAIMIKGAKNINFTNCTISQTGQHAIWFGKGCTASTITNCYINNIGGGGIYLGDVAPLTGVEHTSNIRIHNNILQTGGREFPSAVGIWVGHSSNIEITHNDISDFYYTGISVGWIWGYKPSMARQNLLAYNHIHHIGWDLLSDMAAIYTLGPSEGTVVKNNVIHDVHAFGYGGWGLYTDEGTTGIIMENNLVYNTKTGGFHQHYGKENIIRNNIFAFAKQYQLQATRVEEHRSFNFENNIIVFNKGVVLQGPWNKMNIKMDKNLYWNNEGNNYSFMGMDFKTWQQTANDSHSLISNPKFKNAGNYNFDFTDNKVIRKINFKPFDINKAGVTGDDAWKQKAQLPKQIITAFNEAVEQNLKLK